MEAWISRRRDSAFQQSRAVDRTTFFLYRLKTSYFDIKKKEGASPLETSSLPCLYCRAVALSRCRAVALSCLLLTFSLYVLYLSDLDQLTLGAEHRESQRRLCHPHRGRQTQLLKEDRNVREPEELGRRGQQRRYIGGIGDGSRRGEVPPEQVSEPLRTYRCVNSNNDVFFLSVIFRAAMEQGNQWRRGAKGCTF